MFLREASIRESVQQMEGRFNKVINARNRAVHLVSLEELDSNIDWCLQLACIDSDLYADHSLRDEFFVLQHSEILSKAFRLGF